MANILKTSAIGSVLITVILSVLYRLTFAKALLPAVITFGTIAYHLVMRLLVGFIFNLFMDNKADYVKCHYRVSLREMQLYRKLNVKRWKGSMPSYDSTLFDPRKHSWEEIMQAMCQAELVHETIAILSFLPIIAGTWFGDFPVFIITSVAAAMIDMVFVIMQRYNRYRLLQLIEKKREQL